MNKKTLITGADGFIGSHLTEALVDLGHNVRVLCHYNSWNSIGFLGEIDDYKLKNVEIIHGDIRDAELVNNITGGMQNIYHLSSLIGIPYSYKASSSYVDVNINGALNILNASKKIKTVEKILMVSTSEVYGSAQYTPIDENHPQVAQSPYSATKIAADKLSESYHLSFGLPVIIARPFNCYGPRQTARAVIPTIASQLALGHDTIRLGNINTTRDFNYVEDTVNGIIKVCDNPSFIGQNVNIGTGVEVSIKSVAEMLIEISNIKAKIIFDNTRDRPSNSEVLRLVADNSKIMGQTDWMPLYSIKKGLLKTFDWIKNNLNYFEDINYRI